MLTSKPWRVEPLVRLLAGVIICVFLGSVLAGAIEFKLADTGLRTVLFYCLTFGAVVCGLVALGMALRGGPVVPGTPRFVILLVSFFLSLNLAAFAQVVSGASARLDSIWSIVIGTVSFQGATLALIWWFVRQHGIGFGEAFGFRVASLAKTVLLGAGVAAAAFVLQLGYVQLLDLFRVQLPEQHLVEIMRLKRSAFEHVYLGVFAIFIAPVAEEMLFRGILYPAIKQLGFRRIALWGTAILFALIHMNVGTFVPLMVLAVWLALLYEKTSNLLAPIIAHSCFNAINFGLLHLTQLGAATG